MTMREVLSYEVRASWWVPLLPRAMHGIAGKYFAFKVHRKFGRYRRSIYRAKLMDDAIRQLGQNSNSGVYYAEDN